MRKHNDEPPSRSWNYVNLTFKCARFKGNTRLVLLSLADRADETGFCWPGYADIMRRANCSRAAAAKALNELRTTIVNGMPLLKVVRRFGKSNHYRLSGAALIALGRAEVKRGEVTAESALAEDGEGADASADEEFNSDTSTEDELLEESQNFINPENADSTKTKLSEVQNANDKKFSGEAISSLECIPSVVYGGELKPAFDPPLEPALLSPQGLTRNVDVGLRPVSQSQEQSQNQKQNPAPPITPIVAEPKVWPLCQHGKRVRDICWRCPDRVATAEPVCKHAKLASKCWVCEELAWETS